MLPAARRDVSLSSLGWSSENQRCTTRSRSMVPLNIPPLPFSQFGEELVADRAVIGIDDGRRRALRRCQGATRFARLMMRTSLPLQNDQQALDPLWL